MVTNAKITVDDVKKSAASAATTVKTATTTVTAAAKKAVEEKATAAKKTATKKATTTTKKAATKKTTTKAKKAVATTAVVQYQGLEFSETECLKKAQAGFKKDYKGKTLEELSIYIKPEERKIYYVANKDCVGSVDL